MNPRLAAALAACIWGTTYVLTDILPHNPIFVAAVRAFGGALPLLLIARSIPDRVWLGRAIVLGTFNCGIFFALLFVGAYRLPGGVAGTLQSLVPLFAVFFAWPLLGQLPSLWRIAFILVGSVGVGLLLTKGPVALDGIGILAALGSAVSSGLGAVLLDRWGRPESMIALTSWQLVVAAVELLALSLLIGDIPGAISGVNLLAFAYLCLVGTALPYFLWFYGIVNAGANRIASLVLFSPLVAFVLDAIFRGLVPSATQAIGAGLIMASVVASQRIGRAAAAAVAR
jgi:probable blue pigment (indigoidine) exporter